MFTSSMNKGFTMTFSNNLIISVQFGAGNYCERRSHAEYRSEMNENIISSRDAEIMIWDDTNKNFRFEIDDVKGYCTTEEVAKWIDMVSKAKSIDDLHTISGIVRRDDYEEEVSEYSIN